MAISMKVMKVLRRDKLIFKRNPFLKPCCETFYELHG